MCLWFNYGSIKRICFKSRNRQIFHCILPTFTLANSKTFWKAVKALISITFPFLSFWKHNIAFKKWPFKNKFKNKHSKEQVKWFANFKACIKTHFHGVGRLNRSTRKMKVFCCSFERTQYTLVIQTSLSLFAVLFEHLGKCGKRLFTRLIRHFIRLLLWCYC